MRLSHSLARTSAVIDDPDLVSHRGLVPPVMALAEQAQAVYRVRRACCCDGSYPAAYPFRSVIAAAILAEPDCMAATAACRTRRAAP